MYHQISPKSHPHITPSPKLGASYRNNRPYVIPMRELTRMCTKKPLKPERCVSNPTTDERTPVAMRIGLATNPPTKPAKAPQRRDRKRRRPGPSGSRFRGSD